MKGSFFFNFHPDEAEEAICDDLPETQKLLDDLLEQHKGAITPLILREIYRDMKDHNELKSGKLLYDFLMEMYEEDGMTMPRYAHYVKNLLEYGPYERSTPRQQQPITQDTYPNILNVRASEFAFEVRMEIPDNQLPRGVDFVEEIRMQKDTLADGLWEGSRGSVAVYHSGQVIDFDFNKQ